MQNRETRGGECALITASRLFTGGWSKKRLFLCKNFFMSLRPAVESSLWFAHRVVNLKMSERSKNTLSVRTFNKCKFLAHENCFSWKLYLLSLMSFVTTAISIIFISFRKLFYYLRDFFILSQTKGRRKVFFHCLAENRKIEEVFEKFFMWRIKCSWILFNNKGKLITSSISEVENFSKKALNFAKSLKFTKTFQNFKILRALKSF